MGNTIEKQCYAIAKSSKTRCTKKPLPNSRYCFWHQCWGSNVLFQIITGIIILVIGAFLGPFANDIYRYFIPSQEYKSTMLTDIISECPPVGYLWDSNFKYYAYYPLIETSEERVKKLRSKFIIKNNTLDRNFSDFCLTILFSYERQLYCDPFSNAKSIPILEWSPDNTGKSLNAEKEHELDIFNALRKKGINLLSIFPSQDVIYMRDKERAKQKYRYDQENSSPYPYADNIPPFAPDLIKNERCFYYRIVVKFNCNNRRYRHILVGRTGITYTEEGYKSSKAMYVSDYFFKPDQSEIRIGKFKKVFTKIPQSVNNSNRMIQEFDSRANPFLTFAIYDSSDNFAIFGTWIKELNERHYYNIYLKQMHRN